VDVCAHCHGLWLDQGELTLLLQSTRRSLKPPVAGAAVAATGAAALATTAVSSDAGLSPLREVGTSVGYAVLVGAAETTLEVLASDPGALAEAAVSVGELVSEAMAHVLSAILEGITS
jgi:hypothetical protein